MLNLKPLISFAHHGATIGVSAVLHAAILGAVYYAGTQTYMNEPQQVIEVSLENSIDKMRSAAAQSVEVDTQTQKQNEQPPANIETQTPQDIKTKLKEPQKKQQKNMKTTLPNVQTQPVQNAVILHNSHPIYPEVARNIGAQGRVILLVDIAEHGAVLAVKVLNSSGNSALDNAAKNTVQNWQFLPARKGEQKIASQMKIPINFQLN